jgi:glycosyltransferase involved in cell wall biosynthesis
MPQEGISLFLPAYNEEENVEWMVNRSREVLSTLTDRWEVIVVDDGSTDRTAAITRELAAADGRIRLVSHPSNIGFGQALMSGISSSRYEWIFYTDCDGQFDLDELGQIWPERHDADIISGYRRRRRDPGMRLLYSLAYGVLTLLLFGRGFKDCDSSFKLYRSEIFRKVRPRSTCGVADFEILTLARGKGYRVRQVPVSHYPRRAGTVSFETVRSGFIAWVKVSAITEMFRQLVAFRMRIHRGKTG